MTTEYFNKLHFISHLRIISTLLIIAFHSLCFYAGIWWYLATDIIPLWKILASPIVKIGLTLFFGISGFLFGFNFLHKQKYKEANSLFINKAKRIIIPYLFWGSVLIITMPNIHISWTNIFTGPAHLWFLLVLFELFVITYSLLNYNVILSTSTSKKAKFIDIGIIILSFLPLYIWRSISSHHYILCIEDTLYYLPSFIVGVIIAKHHIISEYYSKYTLITVIFILGLIYLLFLSSKDVPLNSIKYRLPSLLISSCIILLGRSSHYFSSSNRFILFIDNNCMGIYIFNQIIIFMILLNPTLNIFLCSHPYLGPLLLFIMSFLIPLLLSSLFRKIPILLWTLGEGGR